MYKIITLHKLSFRLFCCYVSKQWNSKFCTPLKITLTTHTLTIIKYLVVFLSKKNTQTQIPQNPCCFNRIKP